MNMLIGRDVYEEMIVEFQNFEVFLLRQQTE